MIKSSFQRPSYCTIPMCHFLCNTQHQGRHLTEYAIRTAGFLVFGWNATNHRRCVTCKKLNRSFAWTKMADFPRDRLETGLPFTFVDIDNFGPWAIVYRKTQGMQRATTAGLFCSHAWCLELSMSSSLRS